MKDKKNILLLRLLIVAAFALTFYWVEFSPWSSQALAAYNNGYGTFDMKSYNAETVDAILSETQPEGFRIYDRYLLGDYFFILAFGSLQLMLTKIVYKRKPKDLLFKLTLLIPILRGIFDLFENSLLLYTLKTYPTLHPAAVQVSGLATRCKLFCIGLWIALLLVGICRRKNLSENTSASEQISHS